MWNFFYRHCMSHFPKMVYTISLVLYWEKFYTPLCPCIVRLAHSCLVNCFFFKCQSFQDKDHIETIYTSDSLVLCSLSPLSLLYFPSSSVLCVFSCTSEDTADMSTWSILQRDVTANTQMLISKLLNKSINFLINHTRVLCYMWTLIHTTSTHYHNTHISFTPHFLLCGAQNERVLHSILISSPISFSASIFIHPVRHKVILRGGLIWKWTLIWNKEKNEEGRCVPVLEESIERRVLKQSDRDRGEVRATVLIRLSSGDVMTLPVSSNFLFNSENFIRRKLEGIMLWTCWDGWQVALPAG